jgi:hypothetical protein
MMCVRVCTRAGLADQRQRVRKVRHSEQHFPSRHRARDHAGQRPAVSGADETDAAEHPRALERKPTQRQHPAATGAQTAELRRVHAVRTTGRNGLSSGAPLHPRSVARWAA